MIYLYENHMGGYYISDEQLSLNSLYCDQCGDSDRLAATIQTGNDLLDAIADMFESGYPPDHIEDIVGAIGVDVVLPDKSEYINSNYAYIYKDDDATSLNCNLFNSTCDEWSMEYADYVDCDYCTKRFEYDLHKLNPGTVSISNIEELI